MLIFILTIVVNPPKLLYNKISNAERERVVEDMYEENKKNVNEIEVRITDDLMSAYITVNPVNIDTEITLDMLSSALNKKGIVHGVKQDVLEDIAENKIFYKEFLIAEGEPAVHGEDGYFDIPFSFDFDNKPRIKDDGTVDYNQFENYCKVSAGDIIAVYKPATKGENGINVKGKKIPGRNGREQRQLRGNGFKIDENNDKIYIALVDGRLDYVKNKTINISHVYDVDGDVNHATGDIRFPGDIHIKGNVTAGAVVKAAGMIIVEGHVEMAYLYADQDIVLKNGAQGAGKGRIESGGNISAKFFEQIIVRAKGMITAGAVMNCDIESEESIIISGRIGAIIGGRIKAVSYIESNIIGNMAETKTFVKAGGGSEIYARISKNDEDIQDMQEEIKKIDETIEKLEIAIKEKRAQYLTDKKMELIRTKYKKTADLDKLVKNKDKLMELVNKSELAKVRVNKSIYPGVTINLNDVIYINKSENFNVCYEKRGGNVVAVPNLQ